MQLKHILQVSAWTILTGCHLAGRQTVNESVLQAEQSVPSTTAALSPDTEWAKAMFEEARGFILASRYLQGTWTECTWYEGNQPAAAHYFNVTVAQKGPDPYPLIMYWMGYEISWEGGRPDGHEFILRLGLDTYYHYVRRTSRGTIMMYRTKARWVRPDVPGAYIHCEKKLR